VFPHLISTDIPFSSYPLKAKYVELMGKYKGYNSSHIYCQVKGWSKKTYETFPNDFGKDFKNSMMEGEKMDSHKKILRLKCFSALKILTSPFYLHRLLELFFLPLFSIHFGWQIIFEKFQNSKWTHPLTKLNKIKSCYVENIWLW
jgi:mRNA-degrading endonuclease YafQ of YafQ-DinJ toxin-antitoxin module